MACFAPYTALSASIVVVQSIIRFPSVFTAHASNADSYYECDSSVYSTVRHTFRVSILSYEYTLQHVLSYTDACKSLICVFSSIMCHINTQRFHVKYICIKHCMMYVPNCNFAAINTEFYSVAPLSELIF